jgi:hypothetical protein
MEKSYNSSGDEEDNSPELPNFELKFFDAPPAKRFANLSEQELVEQRHSEKTKRTTNWSVSDLSRYKVMYSGTFRECFQRFGDNKILHKLSL